MLVDHVPGERVPPCVCVFSPQNGKGSRSASRSSEVPTRANTVTSTEFLHRSQEMSSVSLYRPLPTSAGLSHLFFFFIYFVHFFVALPEPTRSGRGPLVGGACRFLPRVRWSAKPTHTNVKQVPVFLVSRCRMALVTHLVSYYLTYLLGLTTSLTNETLSSVQRFVFLRYLRRPDCLVSR